MSSLALFNAIIMIFIGIKFMYFLQINNQFGQVNRLIHNTLSSIWHFMIIFLLWVIWTTFIFIIMGAELENDYDVGGEFGHGPDYKNLKWWVAHFVHNFRNVIGDF